MRDSIGGLASVAFLGFLLDSVLRYGIEVVVARGLGPAALGTFSIGLMVVHLGGILARGGFDQAAQKFVPIYQGDRDDAALRGVVAICLGVPLLVGVGLGLLLLVGIRQFGLAGWLGTGPILALFVVAVPLFAVMRVGASAAKGFKQVSRAAYIQNVSQPAVAIGAAVLAVSLSLDVGAVAAGYLASLLVGAALAVYFLHDEVGLRPGSRITFDARRVVGYALPVVLVASSQKLMTWVDVLMLGVLSSTATVGIYQSAFKTAVLLTVVLQASNAIFPALAADLYDSGRDRRLERVYKVTTKWVCYLTLLGFLFLVVYRSEILGLFGEEFLAARTALLVLGGAQVTASLVGPAGYLLSMSEYERVEVANTVVVSVLNVGLNYLLIRELGLLGAAVATGTSLAVLNVVRLVEVRLLFGFHPYARGYWKGAVGIAVAIPVMYFGDALALFPLAKVLVVGTASLAAFVATVWVLGIDSQDRILVESVGGR